MTWMGLGAALDLGISLGLGRTSGAAASERHKRLAVAMDRSCGGTAAMCRVGGG